MKLKNLACAMLAAVAMASCTAESDAPVNYETAAFTLEQTFNARSVDYVKGSKNTPDLSELPPVSVEEANQILSTLRAQKNVKSTQTIGAKDGESGQKFLTISVEQSVDGKHTLTLQLDMITYEDDGSLYYKDYHAFDSSSLYIWHMSGFGLSTSGMEGMYKFEGNSCLYFKIADNGETYIQVPVKVNGTYHPETHETKFTYSL